MLTAADRSTSRGLPRPVWLLGWVSLATDTATEAIYPLLPFFLTHVLGAGAISLGIIEGAAEAINSVLKIVSGRAADRAAAKRPIVLAGYSISSLARPFIALTTSWPQVLTVRVLDRVGKGIRGAPRDAMLAMWATPQTRGKVYGFHRAMDHAGAVVGPALASLFLFLYPDRYRTLFALTIVPGAVAVALIFLVDEAKAGGGGGAGGACGECVSASVRAGGARLRRSLQRVRRSSQNVEGERRRRAPAPVEESRERLRPHRAEDMGILGSMSASVRAGGARLRRSLRRVRRSSQNVEGERRRRAPAPVQESRAIGSGQFTRFMIVLAMFTLGNSTDAFLLLKLTDTAGGIRFVPLAWSALHVVKAAVSVVGGSWSDRIGRRAVIGTGWLVYAVVYAGFAASRSLVTLTICFLTYGFYFGLAEGTEKALVADLVPSERRGLAFGIYNAVLGLGALAASIVFGLIWRRYGPAAAFGTGASLALVATLLLFVIIDAPHAANSRDQR